MADIQPQRANKDPVELSELAGYCILAASDLRAIRKALHWSQQDMGSMMGLSATFIGMMERGDKPIEARTALSARYIAHIAGLLIAD